MKYLTITIAVAAILATPIAANADKTKPTPRQEATKPAPTKPDEKGIIIAEEMESI